MYLLLLIRVMTTYCACVGTVTERSVFTLFIRAVLEQQLLPFRSRTVTNRTDPFTLWLANVPERWNLSIRCSVTRALVYT